MSSSLHPSRWTRASRRTGRVSLTSILVAANLCVPLVFTVVWFTRPATPGAEPRMEASRFDASLLPLRSEKIEADFSGDPRIAHVSAFDLDRDGRLDLLVCDAQRHRVLWMRRSEGGQWDTRTLADENAVVAPAHCEVVDFDGDGDPDLLIAGLGSVWPVDDPVGSVVWLENDGAQQFTPHIVRDDLRRVTDVQAADFDGDGDLDLAVAEFGYHRGSVLWLENRGDGRFLDHVLLAAPGTVHVPVADFDGDGDPDIAAIVTQNEEEVWGFENLGDGAFSVKRHMLYSTINFDLGGVGLIRTDLDGDGDVDLLMALGDNFELISHHPQPSHGCVWLENRGSWEFVPHRLVQFGGVYGVATGDLDGDGDLDIVAVSMFNNWRVPGAASVVWLENDGRQHFRPWQIAGVPIQLATVACGDFNGDGRDDIAAGGVHITQPARDLAHLTLWLSEPGAAP